MNAPTDEQLIKIEQWHYANDERRKYGLPPTEDDRQFFARNRKNYRTESPRSTRVRKSVASDHPLFHAGIVSPDGFITIVMSDRWQCAVLSADEAKFGPVVDSEAYASFRLQHFDHDNAAVKLKKIEAAR
jgi:hypothetical protein